MKRIMYIAIAAIIWMGCEKKDKPTGNAQPEITVVASNINPQTKTICGHDENNVLLLPVGDTLKMTLSLKALQSLSQYKLEVHENFNCHGHERINRTPWTYQDIVNIQESSNEKNVDINVPIPALATLGNYHFKIQLLDVSGNEALPIEYNVVLFNEVDTIAPDVVIQAPSLEDEHTFKVGDLIVIDATVQDNGILADGYYEILFEDEDGKLTTIKDEDFLANVLNSANINTSFMVPMAAKKGHHHMILAVYDSAGNVTKVEWSLILE